MEFLAPNGKPSNLTPEQYRLVRTPEFKAWFGDWENDRKNSSKVLDENREPKVVYHGSSSDKDYTVFKTNEFTPRNVSKGMRSYEWDEFGAFFSDSKDTARQYDYLKKREPKSFFLNIRNPIIEGYDYIQSDWADIIPDIFIKGYERDEKHDGFIVLNVKEMYDYQTTYNVKNPNQIKLADGSNMTFDGSNPDIRFDDGGEIIFKDGYKYQTKDGKAFADVDKHDDVWHIEIIESKSKGYGKSIMNTIIEDAKKSGVKKIELQAINSSVGFFKKLGFQVTSFSDNDNSMELLLDNKSESVKVYHSTTRKFDEFDTSKLGEATKSGSAKVGFWFTDDVATAKSYARAENWRKVQEFIDSGDIKSATELEDQIFENKDTKYLKEIILRYKNPLTIDADGRMYNDFSEEIMDAIKKAKDNNNDVLIVERLSDNADFSEYTPATHYLVLDNSIIESNTPDIEFAKGGLLAPNGNKSNLTTEQYKLVRTPAFKAWFGDWENDPENASKVIDENGEPKVMYHGSTSQFTVFSNEQRKDTWRYPFIFLTDKINIAKKFARQKLYNKDGIKLKINVYKVFVNMRNPFDIFNNDDNYSLTREVNENAFFGKKDETWMYLETSEMAKLIKDRNYDGVYTTETITLGSKYNFEKVFTKNIGVFNPNQVKLADGTNKTFDSYNPDIRFDDGGRVFGATSRFRPKEIIHFDPPIIGLNGAKLINYEWVYGWEEYFNQFKGEVAAKRVSDWDRAIDSADTGKSIVHQFTVEMPNGETKTVSSESVLILLGYTERAALKSFPSLVNSIKTLAKQKMQLSLKEAQQKQYDELRFKFENSEKPQIRLATFDELPPMAKYVIERGDNSTTYFIMGDVKYGQTNESVYDSKEGKSRYIPAEKPNKTTVEQLNYLWVDERIKENGGSRPNGLYDLRKRVERQERKVKQITEQTNKETNMFVDGGEIKSSVKYDTTKLEYIENGNVLGYLDYIWDKGIFSLDMTERGFISEMYIDSIDVKKESRGKGIAKKLIKQAILDAKQLGVDVITLKRDSGMGCNYGSEYDKYLESIYSSVGFVNTFTEDEVRESNGEKNICAMHLSVKDFNNGGSLSESDELERIKIQKAVRKLIDMLNYTSVVGGAKKSKEDLFIDRVVELIYDGKEFKSKLDIERIAVNEFGFTDKQKVRELTEYAVLIVGREISAKYDVDEAYPKMVGLYSNQPYSTHRTNISVAYGQFSTPAPMAYLMGVYVGINKSSDKIYFEPCGGNGMLTVAGKPEDFVVNELDINRYNNLIKESYKQVLNQDANLPFNFDFKFDGMLANPPFASTSEKLIVNGYKISGLEQQIIIRSLRYLKDEAKVAFIVGGHTEYDQAGRMFSAKDKAFLSYLYSVYYIDDVINLNGSLYGRQGTTFPIRIILIRGKKEVIGGFYPLADFESDNLTPFSTKAVNTFEELFMRMGKSLQ